MWPDDRDLPVEVDAAFGADVLADPGTWLWTSLTDRLRRDPISIKVGKSPGASVVSPSTASVLLSNGDGALTPLHGMSPWWPYVDVGVPMRLRLRWAEDAFVRTSTGGWGTSTSGQAWAHFGGPGSDFGVSAGTARHSHSTVSTLRRTTLNTTLLDVEQVVDVATPVALTGAALVTGVMARMSGDQQTYYWLRCELNPGGTIQLKLSRSVAGTLTEIASLDPVPGLTYSPGVPLRVRADVDGTRLTIKAWPAADPEPSGWQLTATDTTITTPGRIGLQSWLVGGNTNPLPVLANHSNYAARVTRLFGSADQWEPTYLPTSDPDVTDSAVRVTASGVLRRIQQGTPPKKSPMWRTIMGSSPVGYWPCEDGEDAGLAGSALPGHPPLTVTGTVRFSRMEDATSYDGRLIVYGTQSLPDMGTGGSLTATVLPTPAPSSQWAIQMAYSTDLFSAPLPGLTLLEWATPGGTYVRWQLRHVIATNSTEVVAYTAAGASTIVVSAGPRTAFHVHRVTARQSGGNISVTYYPAYGSPQTGSVAGTLAAPATVVVNPNRTSMPGLWLFGHLAVWDTVAPNYRMDYNQDAYGAFVRVPDQSYAEETSHLRLARLAAEDRLPMSIPAVPADGITRMGSQPIATSMALYEECAEADGGILYERGNGLAYQPRVLRYNQPITMTIDLATYRVAEGQSETVLAPMLDDQHARNQWTVKRTNGSSAMARDEANQQRRGVYADSTELNLNDDTTLADQAGWRVHLGTWPTLRDPGIPLDLAANPDLIEAWLACQVGARIQRTNPPAQYPGTADRIIEGWTETLGPRLWMVQLATSPAGPWDVAVANGAQRVAADSATLAAPLSAGAMTMTITGTWTSNPADMPVDVRVGGEQVTVSTITAGTATITARGVNGVQRAWATDTPVDVWAPAIAPL